MRYTYNIVDSRGNIIHEKLPSKEEAHEIIAMMQSQGTDTSDFSIEELQHYTVTGLGRDPDLH